MSFRRGDRPNDMIRIATTAAAFEAIERAFSRSRLRLKDLQVDDDLTDDLVDEDRKLVEDAIATYPGLAVDEAVKILDFFTGLRRKKKDCRAVIKVQR